jgi:hypothetical protein
MPNNLQDVVIAWFSTVNEELFQHLKVGCGRYTKWQDSITGSLKLFRRQPHKLSLFLTLERNHHKFGEPPPISHFNETGDSHQFLSTSPGLATIEAVPTAFFHSSGEIQQIPHVSAVPLSSDSEQEQTSDENGTSDLFPELRRFDTFNDTF